MESFIDADKIFTLRKIAVIEDNPAHVMLIRMTLEDTQEDYQISEYENLQMFEEGVKKNVPDLVIADLNLPDGTAIDLLKKRYGNQEFPVIVMTAQGDESSAVQVMKLGALDYIVKTEDFFQEVPRTILRVWREWSLMRKNELAEQQLIDNEARYRNLFEATTDGIFMLKDGIINDANPSAIRLFKLDNFQELIGKSLLEFSSQNQQKAGDSAELLQFYSQQAFLNSNARFEWQFIDKKGEKIYAEVLLTAVKFFNEPIIQAAIRDVSDRIRSINLLRQSERKFREIFQNSPDAIAISQVSNGEVLLINHGFEVLFGFNHDEVTGKTLKSLRIWSNDADRKKMNEKLQKLGFVEFFETKFIKKEGREFAASVSVSKIEIEGMPCLLSIARDIEPVKQAERKIEASRKQYKYLFDKNPQPMWVYRANSLAFLEVNSAAVRHYGYSRQEFLEMTLNDIRPADEIGRLKENFKTNNWSEFQNTKPWKHLRKDGTEIFVEISSQRILFNGEEARLVLAKDITQQMKAEKALKESEEKFRQIAETVSEVFWITENGKKIYVNNNYEAIFGSSVEELITDPDAFYMYIHPDDKLRVLESDKNFELDIAPFNEQYRIIRPDGQLRWIWAKSSPVYDEKGNKIRSVGIAQDITESKSIEEELRKLSQAVEQSANSVVITDLEGNIEYVNPRFTEITGYHADEVIGRNPRILNSGIQPRQFYRALWETISQGNEWRGLLCNKTKLGKFFWESASISPIKDDKGQIIHYLAIKEDITEKKLIEDQIHYSEKFLNSILDQLPQALMAFNANGNLVKCNKSAKSTFLLDCHKEDSTTNGFSDLAFTHTGLSEILQQAHKGNESNGLEIVIDLSKFNPKNTEKDSRKWFSVGAFSVNDFQSETAAVVLLLEDISSRKKNEELLVRSEERFSRTFNLSPDVMVLVDENTWLVEEINQIGQQRFAKNHSVLNHHISKAFRLNHENQWLELIRKYYDNKGQLFDEIEILSADGDLIYCDISARRIRLEGKYSAIMIIRDISDRKIAELALQEQNHEMIEINKKLAEYRLMALRSVMNPHFIFNCLNSIQFYIGKNEKRKAIDYLSLFSKLIRSVLNSSVDMHISLAQEIEILKYYIDLELLRFDQQFEYVIDVDKSIDKDFTEVPSMLLQPYIENAIIHGLLNKNGKGKLSIQIRQEASMLTCTIEDNGVGRDFALRHGSKSKLHKSLGMSVTEERLEIINQNDNVSVDIIDLFEHGHTAAGTRVILKLQLND
jgi:PAS domain S-box-containing protein